MLAMHGHTDDRSKEMCFGRADGTALVKCCVLAEGNCGRGYEALRFVKRFLDLRRDQQPFKMYLISLLSC